MISVKVMAERVLGQAVDYHDLCQRYNGEYLHHVPEVDRKGDGTVPRTAQVIAGNGFPVDWPLWEADYTKCSPCHPGSDH